MLKLTDPAKTRSEPRRDLTGTCRGPARDPAATYPGLVQNLTGTRLGPTWDLARDLLKTYPKLDWDHTGLDQDPLGSLSWLDQDLPGTWSRPRQDLPETRPWLIGTRPRLDWDPLETLSRLAQNPPGTCWNIYSAKNIFLKNDCLEFWMVILLVSSPSCQNFIM